MFQQLFVIPYCKQSNKISILLSEYTNEDWIIFNDKHTPQAIKLSTIINIDKLFKKDELSTKIYDFSSNILYELINVSKKDINEFKKLYSSHTQHIYTLLSIYVDTLVLEKLIEIFKSKNNNKLTIMLTSWLNENNQKIQKIINIKHQPTSWLNENIIIQILKLHTEKFVAYSSESLNVLLDTIELIVDFSKQIHEYKTTKNIELKKSITDTLSKIKQLKNKKIIETIKTLQYDDYLQLLHLVNEEKMELTTIENILNQYTYTTILSHDLIKRNIIKINNYYFIEYPFDVLVSCIKKYRQKYFLNNKEIAGATNNPDKKYIDIGLFYLNDVINGTSMIECSEDVIKILSLLKV